MTKEIGKVIRVYDDGIEIKIPTSEGCESCLAKYACNFSGPSSAYRTLTLPYQKDIGVGDVVTLEVRDSAQNVSALIVFGSPIVYFLTCFLLFWKLFEIPDGEFWAIGITVVLYVITLVFSNRLVSHSSNFQPKIVKIQRSGAERTREMKSSKMNNQYLV